MRLQTKVLLPIIAVLLLSFAFISFRSMDYTEESTGYVMELMDSKHINLANTLAYMIVADPSLLQYDENGYNIRLNELAEIMGVDEVHITDENGIIRWGNIQEFYGYDFRDGEQSRALLKVLTDAQPIAQEPQPRGIDNVMFQYIAVPRMDRQGIVEVGVSMESVEAIKGALDYRGVILLSGILTSLIVVLIIVWLVSALLSKPLRKLAYGVSQLGLGNLDVSIDVATKDELGLLAGTFNKMTVDLKESIAQNERVLAENERIATELDVATKIQASMLPCIFPAFPEREDFDIYASMLPAKEVGGDFYDFFLIDDNTLAVVMADVSGKGVPAALFMVIAKTLIKNNAQLGKSPSEVFETVNRLLCENNEAGMFVTAFMGYLDITSGKFTFVNAGHNPPLISSKGTFDWLKAKRSFILAGMDGMSYKQNEVVLKPGDELFLYTDGVTEAMNPENKLFTEARLLEIISAKGGGDLKELLCAVKLGIDEFAAGAEQADDITMLSLRYKGTVSSIDELVVRAELENIKEVQDFIAMRIKECPAKIRNKISIAVDEVFANIARYAYDEPGGGVTVRVAVDEDIHIEFEDGGAAYNPLAAEDPDVSLPAAEREIGGLGVFMVKKLMDSVEYRRDGMKNILRIRKKIE